MKTATLAIVLLLASTALLALAPAVEARAFCVGVVDEGCPSLLCTKHDPRYGWYNCTKDWIVCVTEPCPQLP